MTKSSFYPRQTKCRSPAKDDADVRAVLYHLRRRFGARLHVESQLRATVEPRRGHGSRRSAGMAWHQWPVVGALPSRTINSQHRLRSCTSLAIACIRILRMERETRFSDGLPWLTAKPPRDAHGKKSLRRGATPKICIQNTRQQGGSAPALGHATMTEITQLLPSSVVILPIPSRLFGSETETKWHS